MSKHERRIRNGKYQHKERKDIQISKVEKLRQDLKDLERERILNRVNGIKEESPNEWKKRMSLISNKSKHKVKNKKRKEKKIKKINLYNSKGELTIQNLLRKLRIKFIREYKFSDMINPLTGQRLIFDFYLPDHKTCIEFDGKQHFEYCKDFHGDDPIEGLRKLEYQKKKDKMKDDYCIRKKLNLIRISYKDYPNIESIIITWFNS